jgi:ferredoxin
MARGIDLAETLDILKMADESGLVLQPSYSKEILWLCCCCGCCCRAIGAYKRHPNPNSLVSSPFQASLDINACNECEVCLSRCQMGALKLREDKIYLNKTQCIGCGLCVSTCPTGALSLERKQPSGQRKIPRNFIGSALQLGRVRGKLNNKRILQLFLKSMVDNILALKDANT